MPSPSHAEASRRVAVPSRRLIHGGIAATALAALVPVLPALEWPCKGLLLLLFVALLVEFLQRPPRGSIEVIREVELQYRIGRAGHYRLRLHNRAEIALQLSFRETLPAELVGEDVRGEARLEPGESREWEVSFVARERGEFSLLPVGLRIAPPAGLLEFQEAAARADKVVIAPGRPQGEVAWLLARAAALEEHGERRTRRRGADWEFDCMREYVPGDEIRRIDWKASARRHLPMVRQFRSERNAEVVLALDCGRLMESLIGGIRKLDLAMTPVLDLAAVALRRGERVGLLAFDSRPRVFLPPRSGLPQLHAMTAALARLPRENEPTSYLRAISYLETRHRKRSMVVLFTDFTDELSAADLYSGLASLGRRHQLLFVAVSDPHLEEIFQHPDQEVRALFQKAVAGQLLQERRRTLTAVEQLGVHAVDAEPRQLTGPLIRRYLELRFTQPL